MTVTKYADGRTFRNSFMADALEDLRKEFPDMQTFDDGERVLVWKNLEDAENDPGRKAVAEITIEPT